MTPLFLLDAVRALGFGHQVVLGLMVGFAVWYLYRFMGFGRMVGGLVGQGLRYVMAVATFAAVGIAFGWVNPGTVAADLGAGWDALGGLIGRFGGDLWGLVMEVLRG